MAEMTREEFLLHAQPPADTATAVEEAAQAAPPSSAAAAFAQRRNAEDLARLAPGAQTLRQSLGEESGIPLDVEEGMGMDVQFEVARRRTQEDKLRYLAGQYKAGNVRVNKKGDLIVRRTDKDGKSRDTFVNGRDINLGDFGILVAHAPELAGALLGPGAIKAVSGAAKLGSLATASSSALGAQTAGALQDTVVRMQDAAPIKPGEILVERGLGVLADTAAELTLGAGLAGVNVLEDFTRTGQIPSPIKLLQGPIQREGMAAGERITQRTGQILDMSPGQITGNPLVATAEAYLEAVQAGTGPAIAARTRREAQRAALQDWLVDPSTLPFDEEIGRRGIGILTDIAETSDAAVSAVKQQVEREGQTSIKDLLSQRFNRDVAPNPAVIAKTLRNSGIETKEVFETEAGQRYDALWSHPKANVPDVPAKEVADAADEILKVWPKDPISGEYVTRNAPEGLFAKIQEASKLGGRQMDVITGADEFGPIYGSQFKEGMMPLRQLSGLRTFLDQNITGGQAIAGIKEGKLVALRSAVNDTIKTAAAKDPALKALYHRANDFYAENAPRFNNKLIDQLFKRPEHTGYIGDPEFLASLTESGSAYKRIQEFFGRSSDEMRLINREAADSLLRKSLRAPFGDELDAQALRKNMAQLYDNKKTRDVFYGVFGKRANEVLFELDALEKIGKLEGRNINARELTASLDPDVATRPSVQALLDSQLDNELIYSNNVIKRFVKGEVNVTAIRDEEFVNNWLANADLQDTKEVLAMIRSQDPLLIEQIGRRETQKFLREASRSPTPSDVLHEVQGGTGTMPSAEGMLKQLGGKDKQAKLREVIGNDKFELLKDFILVENTEAEKLRLAAGTGIFKKGSVIGALLTGKLNAAEVRDWMKVKTLSYILNSDTLSKWVSSSYKASDIPDLFKVIVTSEPFVAAVADDLKNDSRAFELISTLRHAGFGSGSQQLPPQRSQVPTMTREEFLERSRR